MKRMIWRVGVGMMLFASSMAISRAGGIPSGTRLTYFPATATISLVQGGVTNCAILLTGPGSLIESNFVNNGTNITLQTELTSLDLTGFSSTLGGTVRLLAGKTNGLPASTGLVFGDSRTNFPALSFFNTFLEVQLPGGTNLVNLTPLILQTSVIQVPPLSQFYTNANEVALVCTNCASTNLTVMQLVQMSFTPALRGQNTGVGWSLNVFGTNTLGLVQVFVCTNAEMGAITRLRLSNYTGVITPNPSCDELGETNLLFACALNGNLRAPDWRGGLEGNWVIYNVDFRGRTNLFAHGTMTGTTGVGTQHAPLSPNAVDCSSCQRFEGGMVGHVDAAGPLYNAEVDASYAGEYLDNFGNPLGCCPPPATPPNGFFQMTIDGVMLPKCPSP